MKEVGRLLILFGCAFLVFCGDIIFSLYFGEICCIALMGVELIICGLLTIKFAEKMKINLNKKFTLAMLAAGLGLVVGKVNAIIYTYFGVQYFFALLSAEYVICILLLIKFDDKGEDKL